MAAQFSQLGGKVLLYCLTFLCLPDGCLHALGGRIWILLSPCLAPPPHSVFWKEVHVSVAYWETADSLP